MHTSFSCHGGTLITGYWQQGVDVGVRFVVLEAISDG